MTVTGREEAGTSVTHEAAQLCDQRTVVVRQYPRDVRAAWPAVFPAGVAPRGVDLPCCVVNEISGTGESRCL